MSDPTLEYCQVHTSPVPAVLAELERATHLRTLSPQMLSGAYQGTLLRLLSLMIQPRRILEIGTFTGYATICLAEGLTDDGLLHTIEANDELGGLIGEYLLKAGVAEKVHLHLRDAASIIPTLEERFDLVFIDAGKLDYARHYALALAKMRSGGFLLADNVLWDGKVARGDQQDATAQVLRDFNEMVHRDARVENILLPVRDGIMVVRKI
ncbi:MAG: class I SAM-dependent methyltransferase [Saprospiraceae bacterium]|nr:class I SAM-dependent methyltransferase [Saprospiraceae bacterium]